MSSVQSAYEYVYYEDQDIKVCEPKVPLAPGAIEVLVKTQEATDSLEPSSVDEKVFAVYQTAKAFWSQGKSRPVDCFYLERHEGSQQMRQIIPYPDGGLKSTLRQMQVVWNLTLPNLAWTSHPSVSLKEGLKGYLKEYLAAALKTPVGPTAPQSFVNQAKCPFCDPKRLQAQQVQEWNSLWLLDNYKPLSEHDFLIVPKADSQGSHVSQLDAKFFAKACTVARAINEEGYCKQGFSRWYITFADGKDAGQTVQHPHIHVTNAKGYSDELLAIAKTVRNILIGSWARFIVPSLFTLSDAALKEKITQERKDLESVLLRLLISDRKKMQ